MQDEKQLSGEESLQLINRMIHEAKGYFYETGIGAIVWGASAIICSVLSYLWASGKMQFPFHPFYLMVPVFFVQSWVQYKENKKKKAKTFTDEAIDFVWMGFFISVLAALCAGFAGVQYVQISFIIIIIAGLATFLTGMLSTLRYLKISSFICWGIGIVSFFVKSADIYLLLVPVAIIMWLVPGFIINAYFKKQHHGVGRG